MKFLHTADLQIGMKAVQVAEAGERVREERLHALERVVRAARDHHVEFILVAGDVFEDNGVDRIWVQRTADILAGFGGTVYLIPGNHDPLGPGSVWDHPAWKSGRGIQILREEVPVEISAGLLFPCPTREKHSTKNPTAWITGSRGSGIRVGVAHGTVEGVNQDEPDYPIPRNAAEQAGLDYLALGHWHSTTVYKEQDGAERLAYSGTHETTKFGERDSGNVLIVGIPGPGGRPTVTPLRTGSLNWQVLEEKIHLASDLTRVRENIEAIGNPASTLISIHLSGLLSAETRGEMERVREILSSRFLFHRLDTTHLRPSPGDDSWLINLPPGIIRETASRLRALADPSFNSERTAGATPEVASRALLELYALIEEVHR